MLLLQAAPAGAADPGGDLGWLKGLRAGFGFGAFDVLRPNQTVADFRFELDLPAVWSNLKPWLGVEATSDSDVLGYLGLKWDADIGLGWHFVPSFAVGLYEEGGSKSLDNQVQFRSQIGVGYRWDSGIELGLAFGHISNAGLGDSNPGAETLVTTLSFPIGRD